MSGQSKFAAGLAGVFLAITVAAGAACDFMDGGFGDFFDGSKHTESFSKTLPLKAGDRFALKNTNGYVRVRLGTGTVETWPRKSPPAGALDREDRGQTP